MAWKIFGIPGRKRSSGKPPEEVWQENPYLPRIRPILCQVLKQRGLDYQSLRLAVIDVDGDTETIFWEDKVLASLEELSPDLNGLTIFTDRPAYFRDYVEKMYEETGLLVQLREKSCLRPGEGFRKLVSNLVLDFEYRGGLYELELSGPGLYVPVYKKTWKTLENLDICVPIGYNTVIAKGIGEI